MIGVEGSFNARTSTCKIFMLSGDVLSWKYLKLLLMKCFGHSEMGGVKDEGCWD